MDMFYITNFTEICWSGSDDDGDDNRDDNDDDDDDRAWGT